MSNKIEVFERDGELYGKVNDYFKIDNTVLATKPAIKRTLIVLVGFITCGVEQKGYKCLEVILVHFKNLLENCKSGNALKMREDIKKYVQYTVVTASTQESIERDFTEAYMTCAKAAGKLWPL